MIQNKQYTKEEYLNQVDKIKQSFSPQDAQKFFATQRHPATTTIQTTNSTGNYLINCDHIHMSFDTRESKDSRYLTDCTEVIDCMDLTIAGMNNTSLSYESVSFFGQNSLFCNTVRNSHHMIYCIECFNNCHHCFGCTGLNNKSYCIFNKQYDKAKREKKVSRLIEHMKEKKER